MLNSTHPDLFPETLLVSCEHDGTFTTSLKVAEHFHKRHDNVLRDIEKLRSDVELLGGTPLKFEESSATSGRTKRGVRQVPIYKMDREAFSILAGRFTGKMALRWQLDFYAAFRELERQLAAAKDREAAALYQLRPRWQPIVQHPTLPRSDLITLTGHKSANSITACRRRMRQVGLLGAA